MVRKWLWQGVGLAILALGTESAAQDSGGPLEPIIITSPRVERSLLETPAAVSVVDEQAIQEGQQGLQLDESLSRVPGLYLQNRYNFAQNQRISVRGFGARAPFGIRGIHIRVDGLPLTLPDGQSQVDTIDLDAATRIEVIRGPSSALYGNASGGVIAIETASGRRTLFSPTLRADVGSDGYRKLGVQAGGQDGPWAHHVSLSALDYDGYRGQSEVKKRLLNAKVSRDLGTDRRLTAILTVLDMPTAQDPGGLTREEADADRDQATPEAKQLDSGQHVEQQRIGLILGDDESLPGELTVRTHFSRRDFEQQLPFFPGQNLIRYERAFYGAGVQYADELDVLGGETRYVIGMDVDRQVDDRLRFRVVPGEATVRTQNEEQVATATALFLQATRPLTEKLEATLGLRYDHIRFAIDDRFTADGSDDSGARTFTEPSVTAGLTYQLRPGHRLYANLGTAFQTPTFTEFANPDGSGGFNPEVEPQHALNREIGARGFLGDSLRYDVALFSVRVRDELVTYQCEEPDPDCDETSERDFYRNASRTRREGLELGLEYFATDRLTLTTAYTWADYRFVDFTDDDGNDFSGNRLPGLPRHLLFAEAAYRIPGGLYVVVDGQYVGSVYADNANDTEVGGYTLFNARIGNTWAVGQGQRLEGYVGINNLFGREYFSNIRVNANRGAFFEPGPERVVYAGVELGF